MALDTLIAQALAHSDKERTAPSKPKLTAHRTPCAKSWSPEWVAEVERAETRLGRPICGARTIEGTPCTLPSTHKSGRCRFHGGFDLTGAPKGNRNAVIHGLYSRRLQVCGTHCPLWDACPCAGQDLLDLPPKQRPTCPYEQAQYNAVLTDALAAAQYQPHPTPLDTHHAHHLALLRIMVDRAATALGAQPLFHTTTATGEHYEMSTTKLNPCLQAFLRLSAEYRAFTKTIRPTKRQLPPVPSVIEHDARTRCDTDLDPDAQAYGHPASLPILDAAQRYIDHALDRAAQGNGAQTLQAYQSARQIDPDLAQKYQEEVLERYRPRKSGLRKTIIQQVIKDMESTAPAEPGPCPTNHESRTTNNTNNTFPLPPPPSSP